jgi:thiol:disulfide interchange protein
LRNTVSVSIVLTCWQELQADGAADLVIAKMDATINDPPEYINVRGYPTIYFFPGNNKQTPILFEGERNAKSIKKFLRKNAHNPIPDSKKKAEPKESKKSDL